MKLVASFVVIGLAIVASPVRGKFGDPPIHPVTPNYHPGFPSQIDFDSFKVTYQRQYASAEEEQFRRNVFERNLHFITEHNRLHELGYRTFRVGINQFADLENHEFVRIFNGLRTDGRPLPRAPQTHMPHGGKLPATVDWTTKGVVTPIKNQEQCGSCWAFSAVASIEGQHALKTGKLVSLSEQNLVDCSSAQGDMGCEGGLMDYAFTYVIQNKGIDTEASYPYTAEDDPSCSFKNSSVGATISSYVDIPTGSESALQDAVATVGPISVAIDASQMSFQFYQSGVYDEPACSTTALDHGVTAVGYGTLNGVAYWKVKNSWGTSWGEQGYILMSRNKQNQCGIATKSSYPVV